MTISTPERITFTSGHTIASVTTVRQGVQLAYTRSGIPLEVGRDGGDVVVSDSMHCAWGVGRDVNEAAEDWLIAAREALALLNSERLSPEMTRKRDVLRELLR